MNENDPVSTVEYSACNSLWNDKIYQPFQGTLQCTPSLFPGDKVNGA